jgi:hypothetical protein
MPGACPNIITNSNMWIIEYPNITMDDNLPFATRIVHSRPVLISVVILGSAELDVSRIDPSTLHLNGILPSAVSIQDVSCDPLRNTVSTEYTGCCQRIPDGYADLLLGFSKPALWGACNNPRGDTLLCLQMSGCCFDGPLVSGIDSVMFRRIAALPNGEPNSRDAAIAELEACYPNPFNPSTSFRFVVTQPTSYIVSIYNTAGRLVRELNGHAMPGTHTITWDGTNRSGRGVASGVYFYRVVGDGFAATRKMMLIR